MHLPIQTAVLLWLAGVHVLCHPGSDIPAEARERRDFLSRRPRAVKDCRNRNGVDSAAIRRRSRAIQEVEPDHGTGVPFMNLGKPYYAVRDLRSILSTDHQAGKEVDDNGKLLFADYSNYALQPVATSGPYFVTGELIRENISESQVGVPLVLEFQFINTRTCRPIEDLYLEVWQANATGCYSGVASVDNGESLATLDVDENGVKKMTGGIVNESWLRGVQNTDAAGVVRFKTVVPGWYTGRATHIHLLAHDPKSTERLPNNTVATDSSANHTIRASHVGQVFFDATLLDKVAETHPYNSNTQWRIKNDEDAVLMQESTASDPILQYVMLGSRVEDGIFAWMTIGIDPEMSTEVKVAGSLFESSGRMWRKLWHR